jgi:WD40 repeat protein
VNILGGTSGHSSFVNDIDSIIHPNASGRLTSPPTDEDLVIATVGDDNTLIIWQWQDNESGPIPITYPLSSAGVSVNFCRHFTRRLLVAEEEGMIRILDWLANDDARASSSGGAVSTVWLLDVYMGVGLSMGVDGFMASAEWCGDDVDGEGGRFVAVTKGGEWAVWDLTRIEGGGRTIPVEKGQVIHAANTRCIRSHPSEPSLFAIGSKATYDASALHIVDLTLESISLTSQLTKTKRIRIPCIPFLVVLSRSLPYHGIPLNPFLQQLSPQEHSF